MTPEPVADDRARVIALTEDEVAFVYDWTPDDRGKRVAFAAELLHILAQRAAADPRIEAVRALAWDEGYSTCLGDFDIAARREARSPNPYRAALGDQP